jgi:YCII-related domain
MARFMLLYRGNATPPDQMTEEQSAEVMAQWGGWTEKNASSIVDLGAPFGDRTSIGGDGDEQAPANLNGYTIVEATDLAAATSFCDGHPFLHGTGAEFAVDVFELVDVPMP